MSTIEWGEYHEQQLNPVFAAVNALGGLLHPQKLASQGTSHASVGGISNPLDDKSVVDSKDGSSEIQDNQNESGYDGATTTPGHGIKLFFNPLEPVKRWFRKK